MPQEMIDYYPSGIGKNVEISISKLRLEEVDGLIECMALQYGITAHRMVTKKTIHFTWEIYYHHNVINVFLNEINAMSSLGHRVRISFK